MYIECYTPDRARAGKNPCAQTYTDQDKQQARIEEKPAGTIEQEETQMAPAITPSTQVRRTTPTIRRERRGHFGNPHMHQSRFDDHLAREFHPRGLQVHFQHRGFLETS